MMMTYKAVLFDAAETLFTTRGTVGEIYAEVAGRFGSNASPAELDAAFSQQFQHSGPLAREAEKDWWKQVVQRVFAQVGMVRDFDAFFEEVYRSFRDAKGWRLFPETLEVLTTLQARNIPLGVVSNFDSRVYSVLDSLGIRAFFRSVTISSETGYAKPHRAIFEAAVRSLGIPAETVLFAGDSLVDDYQAAQAAGLPAVLVDRTGRYRQLRSVRRATSLLEIL
jgi:putative hydrolase of the HAD superfamily